MAAPLESNQALNLVAFVFTQNIREKIFGLKKRYAKFFALSLLVAGLDIENPAKYADLVCELM